MFTLPKFLNTQNIIDKILNILKEEIALAEFQTGGKAISIPFEELSTDELRGNLSNQLFIHNIV